ncbi:MAG: hypothetical protein ABI026_06510, partial [Gemmatimonadaceae bacterium]
MSLESEASATAGVLGVGDVTGVGSAGAGRAGETLRELVAARSSFVARSGGIWDALFPTAAVLPVLATANDSVDALWSVDASGSFPCLLLTTSAAPIAKTPTAAIGPYRSTNERER